MSFTRAFLLIIQINMIYGIGIIITCNNAANGGNCHNNGVDCSNENANADCTVICIGASSSGTAPRGGCEDITIIVGSSNKELIVNCETGDGANSPMNACKNTIINVDGTTKVTVECGKPSTPAACPNMMLMGTQPGPLDGTVVVNCASCTDTTIKAETQFLGLYCNTFGGPIGEINFFGGTNSCEGVTVIGTSTTVWEYATMEIVCGADENEVGIKHCAAMTIDASLSNDVNIDLIAGNRESEIFRDSNVICPNSFEPGENDCLINVHNSHISALKCAQISLPGDIVDVGLFLDCNDMECFDHSDTCGRTVQYINRNNNDESCMIRNLDTTWSTFECFTTNPTATPTATPTIQTVMPTMQTLIPTMQSIIPTISTAIPTMQSIIPTIPTAIPSMQTTAPTPCPEGVSEKRNIQAVLNIKSKEECVNMKGGERTALVKSILEKTMNIAEPARLCISLEIIKVECGSFIVDYSLTTNDPDLMNKAVKNINDAVGTIGTIIIEEEIISFTIVSNEELNTSNPNPSDSSDSVSDISSDSSDGMEIQSGYNSIHNMEQSENVHHVGNNVLIEMNLWTLFGFLALMEICIVCCWYAKFKAN